MTGYTGQTLKDSGDSSRKFRKFQTILTVASGASLIAMSAAAAPLQDGNYTYSITSGDSPAGVCSDPAVDNFCSHILDSVTIGGTTYTDFTFPSGFAVSGFPGGSNVQSRIYDVQGDYLFSDANYAAQMLANVFSDRDLNRYQQVDSGGATGTSTYSYPSPIPATSDFFLITTERNGNNDQIIQAFDQNGVAMGTPVTITASTADYSDTGRRVGANQNSFLAVIPMSDFADAGDPSRQVQSIEISYSGPTDGADHKTFVIGAAPVLAIDAVNDDFTSTPIDSVAGGTAGSVLVNDTLDSAAVAANGSETTLSLTDLDGLTGATIADDGTITVPAGTAPGTYTVTYELCDESLPTNCDSATAVIEVTSPTIAAIDDDYSSTPIDPALGGTVGSVLANDTLGGSAVATDGSATLLTITDLDGLSGATIADDGTITVPAGAAEGSYQVAYELCDEATPTSCDPAIATIVVEAPTIVAEDVDYTSTPVNGADGGTVGSVLTNDTLNGSAVNMDGSTVNIRMTDTGGLTGATINDTGMITIPAGTAGGTYTVTYEICEAADPANCDTAMATLNVQGGALIPLIEEDLLAILEDDLAVTMTQQGTRMGNYATSALERLKGRDAGACAEAATLAAKGIFFDVDKSIIKPESGPVLDDIAAVLKTCEGTDFEIGGHTDSDASDAYNIALSQRRVDAVLGALTARGVDTSGFTARGYGERQPIATNATAAGKAQNRRVVFTPIDGAMTAMAQDTCGSHNGPQHSFDASANNNGMKVDGTLNHESYNCVNDYWTIIEGGINYAETDAGISQGGAHLSYRREKFFGTDSVRGAFLGLYGSQSDVTQRATGDITGVGVNAGVYGAERLDTALYLDYYVGAAVGQHDFDLTFAETDGDIDATGDYTYFAGFAGAALSGEVAYDAFTLSPRAGFEYAYSPGGDVDVTATRAALSETGTLDLDSVSGGLVFAELRAESAVNASGTIAAITPRFACYQSLSAFDGECSFGGSLELASSENDDLLSYGFTLEGERGETFSRGSLSAHMSKRVGGALFDINTGMNDSGAMHVGSKMELRF